MTISLLRFAPFSLELANQRLIGPHGVVALRPKSFAVLRYLAQHAGRLVKKAELLNACWPGVAVGDAVLKGCIREIRDALADSVAAPRFIRTQSRLGYWFVAEVTPVFADPGGASLASHKADPKAAVALPAAAEKSAAKGRLPLPLLGRDADLARLAECLALADAGAAQTVFVSGEAGAGKTALVDAFLRRCPFDKVLVGRGQCIAQQGPSESYMPVIAALHELAKRLDSRQVSECLLQNAPTWLLQLPGLADAIDRERLLHEAIGAGRERMLREGADGLAALAPEHCVVLVIEDLQWADAATIEFITYVTQRRRNARLLLLATVRETDGAGSASLSHLRSLSARGLAVSIKLTPLTVSAVHTLVGERLPRLGQDVAHRLASAVHIRTDGNPLFVGAVLDELGERALRADVEDTPAEDLLIRSAERSLPPSIQALAEQVVAGLSSEDQQVLEAASVAGEDATSVVIAAALRHAPADVEVRLESLSRRQTLLKPFDVHLWADGSVWGRYQFVHALFRDVLYDRVGSARKARYHLSIGKYLAERASEASPKSAATLAYHFEQGGDLPSAIHWLAVLAWREVMHLGDRTAARHLDHALTLAERLSGDAALEHVFMTLERRALLSARLGNLQVAIGDYERIVRLAESKDDPHWQARGLAGLAALLTWVAPASAMLASEKAELLAERQSDDTLRIKVRGLHGFLRCLFGSRWSASDAEASLRASQTAPVDAELPSGNFWSYGVQIQSLRGDYEGSRVTAQRGIALALKQNDPNEYLFLRYHQSGALFSLGRFGDALHILGDAQQIAQRNGDVGWAVLLDVGQACIEVQCFAFADAIARSQRALAFARQSAVRLRPLELMSHSILALALVGQGKFSDANDAIAAMEIDEPLSFNTRMTIHIAQLELALAYGDSSRVVSHANALLALTQPAGEPTGLVWARRCLALVASRSHRWDDAVSELSRAASVLAHKPAPVAAWRLHLAAAEIYAAQGKIDDASHSRRQCADSLSTISRSLEGWSALRRSFNAHPIVAQVMTPPQIRY